jgi:transmembrane protein EpsG
MDTVSVKKKTFILVLIFIPLFLISAFRPGLGTDYYSYAYSYLNPKEWDQEFLFKFLFITIPRLLSKDAILFFCLTSFVICFYFFKSIFTNSLYLYVSIIIFISQIYFSSFNIVRQFVPLAIFSYYGFKFYKEKEYLKYYILILILAQFHYSIYLLLLFPILWNQRIGIKNYWIIWLCSFIIFIFQSYNILNFSNLFTFISYLSIISNKFELQAGGEYFFGLYQSNTQLIIKNIICIIFLFRIKHIIGSIHIYWFNLYLFGLLLYNILVKFSLLAVRIGYFGDVAALMLVPIYIKTFSSSKNRIIVMILFILYYLFSFYLRFVLNGESEVFKKVL